MRLFFIAWMMLSMCFYGCKTHSHEGHDHEHEHEHEAHSHEHEGDGHEEHDHEHEGDEHDHEGHDDEIAFTEAQAAKTNLKVEEIQPATFHQIIKTTGQVLPAPGDESAIVATSNGVVSYADNRLVAGSAVKHNQPLFYLSSKNLDEGDYYSRVLANYEKAKAAYERNQELVKEHIVSQKEFEATQLEYQNAKIAYDAISGKQSSKGVSITSPLNGYIKNIVVKDGEYVTAGQTIATVSQNRRLVLQADVSEKHYASLSSIQSANFKTPYDNEVYVLSELAGKLLSTGKAATANTFFIPVTFEFDNQGAVIPGSFVEIFLISRPMENVLSLPVSALTNEMGHYYIYKQVHKESYQKQEVKIGANDGRSVQILSGLAVGDRVVTQGAYQIKMASASAAIPGHAHNH